MRTTTAPTSSAKHKHKLLFYSISLALPLLIIGLIEALLRLGGLGGSYPLFVPSSYSSGYLQTNPQLMLRYFPADAAPAISPDTVLFKAEKPADSFRIVIQGESSAAGFPYGRFGSLQGMLTQRFKRTYPDKQIEIINTAMSAVSSYNLLDFVDEIQAIEPDLVLIYAGHNEYLGLFGVGSSVANQGSRWQTLLYFQLRQLRIYQLLQQLFAQTSERPSSDKAAQYSLMSEVAKGAAIEKDSAAFRAGEQQFADNLSAILDQYQQAGIPVMLGTLISNEADQVPFSAVPQANWPELKQQTGAGTAIMPPDSVVQHPASLAFFNGLTAQAKQQNTEALTYFRQAIDFDQLRFRAPSSFNSLIRTLAAEKGAVLVDVEQQLRTAYPLFGANLLLEHVHPNVKGYFLLSEVFYQHIVESDLLGPEQHQVAAGQAWADIPLSELDVSYAELKIDNLVRQPPFTTAVQPAKPRSYRSDLEQLLRKRLQGTDWLQLQTELLQLYLAKENLSGAAKVAGMISDALPDDVASLHQAGLIYMNMNDLQLASYYLNRVVTLDPQHLRGLLNLAQLRFLQGDFAQSLNLLQKAKQINPGDPKIDHFIHKVKAAGEAH